MQTSLFDLFKIGIGPTHETQDNHTYRNRRHHREELLRTDRRGGKFRVEDRILHRQNLTTTHAHQVVSLLSKDSRELTPDDRKLLLEAILTRLSFNSPFVITHGTDTILETAKYLEANLPALSVPIVLTGAMRPLGFENSDGIQNLAESLFASKMLQPGVHLVMHGEVFNIHRARKDLELGTFIDGHSERA
jgi:L-asparaginase